MEFLWAVQTLSVLPFLSCDNFDSTRNVKNYLTNVKKQSVTFAYYGKYDYLCNNCE